MTLVPTFDCFPDEDALMGRGNVLDVEADSEAASPRLDEADRTDDIEDLFDA